MGLSKDDIPLSTFGHPTYTGLKQGKRPAVLALGVGGVIWIFFLSSTVNIMCFG